MPEHKPSLVVRGSFNPAIITPKWLRDQGIIEGPLDPDESEKIGITVNLELGHRGGFSRELQFPANGVKWVVSETRIKLEPTNAFDATSDLLLNVLEKLPHTPVTGVGHNLRSKFPTVEWKNKLPHLQSDVEKHLTSLGSIAAQSHAFRIASNGNRLYNITIEEDVATISVDINIHYEINSMSQARETIGSFAVDIKRAIEIANNIATGTQS